MPSRLCVMCIQGFLKHWVSMWKCKCACDKIVHVIVTPRNSVGSPSKNMALVKNLAHRKFACHREGWAKTSMNVYHIPILFSAGAASYKQGHVTPAIFSSESERARGLLGVSEHSFPCPMSSPNLPRSGYSDLYHNWCESKWPCVGLPGPGCGWWYHGGLLPHVSTFLGLNLSHPCPQTHLCHLQSALPPNPAPLISAGS